MVRREQGRELGPWRGRTCSSGCWMPSNRQETRDSAAAGSHPNIPTALTLSAVSDPLWSETGDGHRDGPQVTEIIYVVW